MKYITIIASAILISFPLVSNALMRCGYYATESATPVSFGYLVNILDDNQAPTSAEDVTYDYSNGCPAYLNLTGKIGDYDFPSSTSIAIYGADYKKERKNDAGVCQALAHPDNRTPVVAQGAALGNFIYCASYSDTQGSPPSPPPFPENKRPSPPPSCRKSDTSTPNPVFLPTGEKYLNRIDWVDNGPHPLTVKRVYRSLMQPKDRALGSWTHNFDNKIQILGRVAGDPNYVRISSGDGKHLYFQKTDGSWVNTNGYDTLTKTTSGWRHVDFDNQEISVFNNSGNILNRTSLNGWKFVYSYNGDGLLTHVTNSFGRTVTFDREYYTGVISVKINGTEVVKYKKGSVQLEEVTYPDGAGEIYSYNNQRIISSVADATGAMLASFEYDSEGRAVITSKPANTEKYGIFYNSDGSVKVTNPIGNDLTYSFSTTKGKVTLVGLDKPKSDTLKPFSSRSLGADGFVNSEIDFLGRSTTYTWNTTRRLPLTTTEAVGTSEARKTTTAWHSKWRLPTKITVTGREISYTYDSLGNALTQTIKDTSVTPAQSRTWTWTYFPSGLVATETEPNGAVSSFSYDSQGNLTQAKNALDQLETYSHDAAGRVLTHTSASGLVSSFQYDSRGRLARVQLGDQVTVYTYRSTGHVATVTAPSGYQVTYDYDAAQRLVGWSDNRGASATYTLDGMGNRVNESITDAQGQTAWKVARTINSLNRIESITAGGAGDTLASISYGYDENGDVIRSTETVDGATRNTDLGLDALRRAKTVTSAQNASAALKYNALDAVTKATDFKGVATNYTRDALGNAKQETTPDAGTLASTYDNLGLPQSITDAMGRAASITRDSLGRPTQIVSTLGGATRTTVLRYDLPGSDYNGPGAPQASIGFLSEIQDPEVTTRFQRDLQGRITRKTQILASSSLSVGYAYVPAGQNGAGQIASLTYPSGKQLTYTYDTTGRLTGLSWADQPLVSGLEWSPLGQPMAWQWPGFSAGPGSAGPLAEIRSYTSAGQLADSALLNLTWDSAGRVSRIQQKHMLPGTGSAAGATAQQTTLTSVYTYNPVGRLTASAHSAPAGLVLPSGWSLSDVIGPNTTGYAWDANGNRTQAHYSFASTAGTTTLQRVYQTTTGTNRLSGYTQTFQEPGSSAQVTNLTYAHDAAGSLTKKGDNHLHYGVDGRIAKAGLSADANQAAMVNYTYNLLSQRLLKSDSRLSSATPATEQTMYADDSMGSTVLGLYGNRRSTHSAALAWEADSTEVIYLPTASGPMPIAVQINGRLYAIDSDHLNTPRRLTNTQGQVAWQWLITGFGEVQPTQGATGYALNGIENGHAYSEAVMFNLRYPGQQWDEESQLSYNLNRYYDAQSGRYIQSDPIGLDGGWNRFAYVGGNPVGAIDPQGLTTLAWCFGGPVPCAFGVGATVAAAGWGVWSSGQNMTGPTGDYSPWSPNSSDNESFVNDRDAVKELDVPPPPYQDPNKPDCDELKSRIKHYDRAIKARELLTQRWYNGVLNSGHAMRIDILKRDRDRIQRRLDRGDCKPC